MRSSPLRFALGGVLFWSVAVGLGMAAPVPVQIVPDGNGWKLLRAGQPYFVKGAVGSVHLDDLVAAGGNAIRAQPEALDEAQASGLTVLVGLPFGKQRWGFDYGDAKAVQAQRDEIRKIVEKYRDHPAVLAWALGNESEINTTAEQRAVLWREADAVAQLVHQLDPHHPVITVIGSQYKEMLHELNEYCPHLDAVGLNAYADMLTLPEDLKREGWTRAYWITEFGPRGHWQVPKTPWKLPLEDSSTAKAGFYRKAYLHSVQGQPACLGSYVFHWAQHHEKTHTWYGMFLEDGSRTESVDTMTELWSGHPPANRSPHLGPAPITASSEDGSTQSPTVLPPGALLHVRLDVADPDHDTLRVTWDLRLDVSGNTNTGGDHEDPTPPLPGVVLAASDTGATLRLPDTAGDYRLFAYARDGRGNAATANLPLRIAAPAFPPVAPDPAEAGFGTGVQRTMTLLASSTPNFHRAVRILFYGQSLTKQAWTRQVASELRQRFPHADITFANRAIGGYSSEFLRRTLPHDVYDFYPDLVIFHDFGGEPDYEAIIRDIRRHTTAEILIQNDRPDAHTVAPPPEAQEREAANWTTTHNDRWLPALAARYGCEIADVRQPYLAYLRANHLQPDDLLNDHTHFNFHGDFLIAELTGRHLRHRPDLPTTGWAGWVQDHEVGRDLAWVDGKLELEFEGNRIDLVSDWANPFHGSLAEVWIDGRRPSEHPELYHLTRPSDNHVVDWPVVNRISATQPLAIEDWTLRVLETNADESQVRFEVQGSVTGPDGSGSSTERFVSKSGRVVIEPQDWTTARAFAFRPEHTPPGFEVHWKVLPLFADVFGEKLPEDLSRERVVTVASGLANTKHRLVLVARGPQPPALSAIRIYRPPVHD